MWGSLSEYLSVQVMSSLSYVGVSVPSAESHPGTLLFTLHTQWLLVAGL
jgi:hypothetical protein